MIHVDDEAIHCLEMRRCSSCRLYRCFEIGMRHETIRTDEENKRHKQLVSYNRNKRALIKQQQKYQLFIIRV